MRRATASLVGLIVVLGLAAGAGAADQGEKSKNLVKGKVVTMDGRTLVVETKEGEVSLRVDRETKYLSTGQEVGAGGVQPGDRVRVKWKPDGDDKLAVRVDIWSSTRQLPRSSRHG